MQGLLAARSGDGSVRYPNLADNRVTSLTGHPDDYWGNSLVG